jgi:hypothetical protein
MAGNGLSGTIPELTSPSLVDIGIAHNYITGRIPLSLQRRGRLRALDLSFNRVTGEFEHGNVTLSSARISLRVNRLSGPLHPAQLAAADTLNILDGESCEASMTACMWHTAH